MSTRSRKKRKGISKKQEDRELIRFLDHEIDELPYELRLYFSDYKSSKNDSFQILSVECNVINNDTDLHIPIIPLPKKSTPKPPPKNPQLPPKKSWK
eukprot:333551_1